MQTLPRVSPQQTPQAAEATEAASGRPQAVAGGGGRLSRADRDAARERIARLRGLDAELVAATEARDVEKIRALLGLGASASRRVDLGTTALMAAASAGAMAAFEVLLPISRVNAKQAQGISALMIAASSGNAPMLNALLAAGADPRARDVWSVTALMRAAQGDAAECLEILLPLSDPLAQDLDGESALMWAASCAKAAGILAPVSDANAKSKNGSTALMLAISKGALDVVELLAPWSDLNLRDKKGRLPEERIEGPQAPLCRAIIARCRAEQERVALLQEARAPTALALESPKRRPKAL
jgi:ankyrin repeat protein